MTLLTILTTLSLAGAADSIPQKSAKIAAKRFAGIKAHRSCQLGFGLFDGQKKPFPAKDSAKLAGPLHKALGGTGKVLRFGDDKTFEIESKPDFFAVTLINDTGYLVFRTGGKSPDAGEGTVSGEVAKAIYTKLATKAEAKGEKGDVNVKQIGNVSCGEAKDIEGKPVYSCSINPVGQGCLSP